MTVRCALVFDLRKGPCGIRHRAGHKHIALEARLDAIGGIVLTPQRPARRLMLRVSKKQWTSLFGEVRV